ncbi:hypothetical protein I549_0653 [Mycobacterium avium subsp. avium 2285 (R)]|nr:hypothetical protein I549_0653 [Mycobacterium avium subsp. avium 2285 (R)]
MKPAEIAKYPTGPLVGIPGAPAAMPVHRGAISAWAVCDTAGRPRSPEKPVVTSIAGPLEGFDRAAPLRDDAGLLVTFEGNTYVIWGGKRSQIDPVNRAVTLSLGLDPGVTLPVEISRALFDALPATEPLGVPRCRWRAPRRRGCRVRRSVRCCKPRPPAAAPSSTCCCPTGCKR